MPENKVVKVSIYDPFADAFREVPIEIAKRFLQEVENITKAVEKAEKESQ